MKILFNNKEELIECEIKFVNNNIVELSNVEQNLSGFKIYNEFNELLGDYSEYTTLYKNLLTSYQLSNDGSVYVEPEPTVPYEPTLEEVKNQKIEEISNKCNEIIFNGIDVDLSIGKKHFSLTIEDQLNLFGKQSQILSGEERFEYHADGEGCIYFSKEDMMKTIQSAMQFVSYHTTYCNSMFQWIKSLESKENILTINYGDLIPEEYQSEVLKTYNTLMEN